MILVTKMSDRPDFNSPEYKAFRYAVLSRDNWTCALTGKKGSNLEVHHIVPWSVAPNLRYALSNGITLSKEMHDMVTGREKEYEEQFKRIVSEKMFGAKTIKGKVGRKPTGFKPKWRPRNPNLRYG